MNGLYGIVSVALLLALSTGLYRLLRGPTHGDRMLAAQLFGTAAVAILLVDGVGGHKPYLVDVALVFALLAAVAMIAFVRRAWPGAAGNAAVPDEPPR